MSLLKFYNLLLLISLVFNFSCADDFPGFPCTLVHPHDKKVLLHIKQHMGNPSTLESWDPNSRGCCGPWIGWQGVVCDGQGHVTSLQMGLPDEYHGPIPPFLDRLPALTSLVISIVPNLSGPIPSYIGKLTNLTNLMLFDSSVGGTIPKFLGKLINLNSLSLTYNKFTGPIPKFIGHLKKLTELDLSNNRLTGSIPPTLGKLTSLESLSLHFNYLSGPIPSSIGSLAKLTRINLNSNNLSGCIPESMGRLTDLTFLSLAQNKLNGSIPKSLGRNNIQFVWFADNEFTGDASFMFDKNNTAVLDTQLNNNLLKFDLSNVEFAPHLFNLNISHNMIYGSLPKLFYRAVQKIGVDVSYNQLCGPIYNGRRLKRMDPTIISHNKCLCGGPLPGCK